MNSDKCLATTLIAGAMIGIPAVAAEQSGHTPDDARFPIIGRMATRPAAQIQTSMWSIGGETLDRDYAAPDSPTHAGFLAVRRCQEQVAASVPSTYMFDTDGPRFNILSDRIHFSAAGQQALGAALAEKFADILTGTKDSRRMDIEKGIKHP